MPGIAIFRRGWDARRLEFVGEQWYYFGVLLAQVGETSLRALSGPRGVPDFPVCQLRTFTPSKGAC